jgi:hypothetical protein
MTTGIIRGNAYSINIIDATLDVASVAANTSAEQTFTVNGLTTKDVVFVNKSDLDAGLGVVNARVSAANTLALTFMNTTGSPINPASETYKLLVVRPESNGGATAIVGGGA